MHEQKSFSSTYIWQTLQEQARQQAKNEPILASFLFSTILNHHSLASALSFHLANKLGCPTASALMIREVIEQAISADPSIVEAAYADLNAIDKRDSACCSLLTPMLFYKGFHALQCYRIAHFLWQQKRKSLALLLQNRISMVFSVDIHPAAQIGSGIMFDHAAVVEDNVSIMQAVTLGGTGKESGDRHPKVRAGVLISAGAKILGNIEIGTGAKVGAGSVVLKSVAPHTTVAGVPARVVGCPNTETPALEMDHKIS